MSTGVAVMFPTSAEEVADCTGTLRAGGTDLMDRRHIGVHRGSLIDLCRVEDLGEIEITRKKTLKVGASVRLSTLANHPDVVAGYAGLAAAVSGLATPQIRNRATVGGALLQDVRCWYYRSPDFHCLRKGGATCFAREGDHLFHSCFDLGPCVAVHPSTLAVALMAYEAEVTVEGEDDPWPIAQLIGDGTDPTKTHMLKPKQLFTGFELAEPEAEEGAAWFRAMHRARAEWPLAEVVARIQLDEDGLIAAAWVAAGGVAPIPLRLTAVEEALVGMGRDGLGVAAARAAEGAKPLRDTAYKVDVLVAATLQTLELAFDAAGPKEEEIEP
jgi:xanthine dehydrogenase YagS FAD-binding subunit